MEHMYFHWYLEASKYYQEHRFASLQNKILRLTEANKGLKKEKIRPYASLLWLLMLRPCLRHHFPPFLFCCLYHLYTLSSPIKIFLPNFPFPLELSLPHFSLNLSNQNLPL